MILALCLVALVGGHLTEPDLLAAGKRIAATDFWSGGVLYQANYEWIGANELIYYPRNDGGSGSILRWNVSTGKREALDALSLAFARTGSRVGAVEPSPDGKLFLGMRDSVPPTYVVTDIVGKEVGSWPVRRPGGFHDRFDGTKFTTTFWTADGRGVVESVYDWSEAGPRVQTWFRDLANPRKPVALGVATLQADWVYSASPDYADVDHSFKVALDPSKDFHGIAKLIEWPNNGARPESSTDVSFQGAEISGWQFSPDGKRILWETTTAPASPGSWVYEPKDSPKRPKGPHYVRLWLTNSDGWGVRLLGRVELKKGEEYKDWHTFGQLRFVPGGRAASFVFRHGLYVVPF